MQSNGPHPQVYYAYTFYTGLLEEQTLRQFRAGWLEALGDLARYCMAVAAMVTGARVPGPEELTTAALSAVQSDSPPPSVPPSSTPDHPSNLSARSSSASEMPAARIDDSPSPSVGLAAAMSNRTKRGGDASLETGTPKVWQTLRVPENYTITSVC